MEEQIYLVSNYDPETISFTGSASMAFLILGVFYSILAIIFTFKQQRKSAMIFTTASIVLYVVSIILLILWATYLIINQINGITSIFEI